MGTVSSRSDSGVSRLIIGVEVVNPDDRLAASWQYDNVADAIIEIFEMGHQVLSVT